MLGPTAVLKLQDMKSLGEYSSHMEPEFWVWPVIHAIVGHALLQLEKHQRAKEIEL